MIETCHPNHARFESIISSEASKSRLYGGVGGRAEGDSKHAAKIEMNISELTVSTLL